MQSSVVIHNKMPSAIHCVGVNVRDTKGFTINELMFFFDRDIRALLKRLSVLEPTFETSLLKHDGFIQVRIAIEIRSREACNTVKQEVENLLWSYNEQILIPKNGCLKPLKSRFHHKVEVNERA